MVEHAISSETSTLGSVVLLIRLIDSGAKLVGFWDEGADAVRHITMCI